MPKELKMVLLVLTMAAVTYAIRAIPFAFFRKKIKSRFILNVLYYVPYAVLAAMIFPAVFYCTGNIYTALVGTVVAVTVSFIKSSMLLVAVLSAIAVFAASFIF